MTCVLLGWEPMVDPQVRYERDVECRVARIACGGSCTTEQLAKLWNCSRQRISQIELRALKKLKRLAARGNLDALEMLALLTHERPETFAERMENMQLYRHGECLSLASDRHAGRRRAKQRLEQRRSA